MSYLRLTFASHRIALFAGAVATLSAVTPAAAGCNSGDVGNTSLLTSLDCRAIANAPQATAVGAAAEASFVAGTAFGHLALARGNRATAVGFFSGSGVRHDGATMVGAGAIGRHYATALGIHAEARGDFSIASGGGNAENLAAIANGYRSIAIGQTSSTGDFGTSVGFNTNTAFASTAIGTDAQALADSSTAVGRFAKASANGSLALGQGAVATKPRSVAIGSSSLANVADTVSVGINTARRRIVNVQNGVANSDAATFGQVKAIATTAAIEAVANETIAKAVGETVSNDLQRELRQMRSVIERLQQEIAELKTQNTAALAK